MLKLSKKKNHGVCLEDFFDYEQLDYIKKLIISDDNKDLQDALNFSNVFISITIRPIRYSGEPIMRLNVVGTDGKDNAFRRYDIKKENIDVGHDFLLYKKFSYEFNKEFIDDIRYEYMLIRSNG